MQVQGFLCVDGVELVNHMRTLSYLRAGLGGPEWDVRADGQVSATDPSGLDCYCPVIADDEYVDPATDEAPWYVAAVPASGEFLGVLLNSVEDRQPTTRGVTRLAAGGARVTPWVPTERSAAFEATLVASTQRGMEWGRRWVSDLLHGGMCGGCEGSEHRILPSCPDDADDESAFRSYTQVALIDPPTFTAEDDQPECYLMSARWQIAAGTPWLTGLPAAVDGHPVTLSPDETISVLVTAEEWNGQVAVDYTLEVSGDQLTNVRVAAYPMADGWDCPEPGSPNACYEVVVAELEPAAVLEVLSSQERAWHHNPTTKQAEPPWNRLTLAESAPYLVVPACSSMCVQVTNGSEGELVVTLSTVVREL